MINIDQEALCKYCEETYAVSRDRCEGSHCNQAKESYMEKHELSTTIFFKHLKIGDIFYFVKKDSVLPELREEKINLAKREENNALYFSSNNHCFSLNRAEQIKTSKDDLFTSKTEAIAFIEELCIKRIISLSKLIGTINPHKK